MTPEQKAAFVVAQAALLNARVAGMTAENQYRSSRGLTIAYGEDAFVSLEREFEGTLGHNAVLLFFASIGEGL